MARTHIEIPVNLELVTTAYPGSVDKSKTDGLRPPTLRHMLRFWWRALHPDYAPAKLLAEEAKLFGSAATGQGLRVIPVTNPATSAPVVLPETQVVNNNSPDISLAYMAFGPVTLQGRQFKNAAAAIDPPANASSLSVVYRFRLALSVEPAAAQSARLEILKTLGLLQAFGGFGSRSRRGYGSVQLVVPGSPLTNLAALRNRDDYAKSLKGFLGFCFKTPDTLEPQHPAFSDATRVFVGNPCGSSKVAHKSAADMYYRLRRLYGATYNHADIGEDTRRMIDLSAPPGPGALRHSTFGSAFGLPHNYFFSSTRETPAIEVYTPDGVQALSKLGNNTAPKAGTGRRASSLHFKVVRIAGNQYLPVILWMPSLFLPPGYEVRFRHRRRSEALAPPSTKATTILFDGGNIDRFDNYGAPLGSVAFSGLLTSGWIEVK